MKNQRKNVNLYKNIPPLLAGGLVLVISFYFCILASPVYIYLLPVVAALLVASFCFFLQTNNKLKKWDEKNEAIIPFYKRSKAIYFAFFLYLLSVCFIFLPVYSHGGNLFVWLCFPLSMLCLATCWSAKNKLAVLTAELPQLNKKIT